jgi:hypothetical protein
MNFAMMSGWENAILRLHFQFFSVSAFQFSLVAEVAIAFIATFTCPFLVNLIKPALHKETCKL